MFSLPFILSVLSMITIGVAWFLAAKVSKTLSPLLSTLVFQAVGIPFFLFLFPFNPIDLSQVNILGLLAVGVYETFIMLLLFRAMREGDASVVLPVTDSYAVVTFVLGVLLLGESFTVRKLLAACITILGIVLLSIDISKLQRVTLKKGVQWAVLSSLGTGVYFYWVTILARGSGWFYTALIIRMAISVTACIIIVCKRQINRTSFSHIPWAWVIPGAVLDVIGFSLYNLAVTTAETSNVTLIVSASSLVIVFLGVTFLKETLTRFQIAGAVFIVMGLILLQA